MQLFEQAFEEEKVSRTISPRPKRRSRRAITVLSFPVGWATANEINKTLEDLGKQIGQPTLDAKAREYLAKQIELHRKALSELQAISAYDLAIRALEKVKIAGWITEVMKLARPDFERREVVRAEKEETLGDFPIEAALWLRHTELKLARLQAARQWIP